MAKCECTRKGAGARAAGMRAAAMALPSSTNSLTREAATRKAGRSIFFLAVRGERYLGGARGWWWGTVRESRGASSGHGAPELHELVRLRSSDARRGPTIFFWPFAETLSWGCEGVVVGHRKREPGREQRPWRSRAPRARPPAKQRRAPRADHIFLAVRGNAILGVRGGGGGAP